jgi:tetratricopeptide (TPR) repeat protein
MLFLEKEISPLGGLALKELSQFYSDSKKQQYNDPQKAISIAEQMVSRDRSFFNLKSLALAHAEAGEFKKAADVVKQAIPLAKNDEAKSELEVNLDLYNDKKAPPSMSKSDWDDYYYDKAIVISNSNDSRKASYFFKKATNYVPDYKDSASLRKKHKKIADEEDVEIYYQEGLQLLKNSKFQDAATAFNKSQEYIPDYKNAAKLENEAKNAIPGKKQLYSAVANALRREIPISWVGNLTGGRLKSLNDLHVVRVGIYNKDRKYWPMKIRCSGVAALNDPFNKGKLVSFDKVGEFLIFRDDYGDWQAMMRGGMFQ